LTEVPIREAATLALLRDQAGHVEVFLLRRTTVAVFSPGAHVFPGGALDPGDRDPVMLARADGDRTEDLPYRIAAIRETFEEAGLLLARPATSPELLRLDDPELSARFGLHRKGMIAGEQPFVDICGDEDVRLVTDRLVPFGHWVTPVGPPRRFDTRFFVARAPEHQDATHDDVETIAGSWTRPADALAAFRNGALDLILPTQRSLETLATFATVDAALAGLAR
jgi:8-oxo-dGTP pyrophosphatase MutT (NUDIX family)